MPEYADNIVQLPSHPDDGIVEGLWPLLPEGQYSVSYTHHETAFVYGAPKVFVHFDVVEPGYHGKKLYRAYRLKGLIGKPSRFGRFKVGPRSEIYLALAQLLAGEGFRRDRISLRPLKGLVLKATVRTVKTDHRQRKTNETQFYSVIGDLLSIEAGTI